MSLVSLTRPRARGGVADRLAASLRTSIVRGRLRPGDPLPSERELADQYEVNRSSVREAMKRLEAWGLVKIRHGGATRVERLPALGRPRSSPLPRRGRGARRCHGPPRAPRDPRHAARLVRRAGGTEGRPGLDRPSREPRSAARRRVAGARPCRRSSTTTSSKPWCRSRGTARSFSSPTSCAASTCAGASAFSACTLVTFSIPASTSGRSTAIRDGNPQEAGAAMREHATTAIAAAGKAR